MPKAKKTNRELKKQPQKTLMEKRAAKKSKDGDNVFSNIENAVRRTPPASGNKRT